jgi:hypothetical protein
MFIDPDGMRKRPSNRNTQAHMGYNKRPSTAGIIKYTKFKPISRNNPVSIQYYKSGYNGNNSTSPLITRNNPRGEILTHIVNLAGVSLEMSESTRVDYGFPSANVTNSQGQYLDFTCSQTQAFVIGAEDAYRAELNERTSHLEMPTMPLGDNVTAEDWQQYQSDIISYNIQIGQEKQKMGPSPIQQIINYILNSDDYDKYQWDEPMQLINQSR